MSRQPHIDAASSAALARLAGHACALVLTLGLGACAAPAPAAAIPTEPPITISDAGADDAPIPAPADATPAVGRSDGAPAATTIDRPGARGPVFVTSDGTCWLREQVTCAANTDCKLPPHRQVACPPPAD